MTNLSDHLRGILAKPGQRERMHQLIDELAPGAAPHPTALAAVPEPPADDFNALVEALAARTLAEAGGAISRTAAYRSAAQVVARDRPELFWEHRRRVL